MHVNWSSPHVVVCHRIEQVFTDRIAASKPHSVTHFVGRLILPAPADTEFQHGLEVLRVKGELLVRHGGAKHAEVEQCFLQSIDWARQQKALSWELRTSISMARFWRDRDRAAEASELLGRVYRRFTEGFETTDLQNAKALLDALG